MTIIYASGDQKGNTIPTNYDFSLADDLILMGTEAQQPVNLGAGDDQLIIQGDGNTVNGGLGNDLLDGTDGTGNILNGDEGNDTIFGGINDTINGGSGRDVIYAGVSGSTIDGGLGIDLIYIATAEIPAVHYKINNFNPELDRLGISLSGQVTVTDGVISGLFIDEAGDNQTIIRVGTDNTGAPLAELNGDFTEQEILDQVVVLTPDAEGKVTVPDFGNNAPTVDDVTLQFDIFPNLEEVIGTVTATDPDEDEIASYAITGGTGAGFFTIDASTGVITISATDGLTAGLTLDITATDALGLTSAVKTLTVGQDTITNTAPVVNTDAVLRYDTTPAVGEILYLGDQVLATDAEGQPLTYDFAPDGNPGGFFAIAPNGTVTFADVDLTGLTSPQTITIIANDGLLDSAAGEITIQVNNAPVVTAPAEPFKYDATPTAGETVGTVTATDADFEAFGDTLTYAITGGTGAQLFNINAETGAIFLDGDTSTVAADELSAEQLALLTPLAKFSLNITVTDPLGDTGTETVDITGTPAGAFNLDIDEDGNIDLFTDGLMIIRYLSTGNLTQQDIQGLDNGPNDLAGINTKLDNLISVANGQLLDIDNDTNVDLFTDGLMIIRYLSTGNLTQQDIQGLDNGPNDLAGINADLTQLTTIV